MVFQSNDNIMEKRKTNKKKKFPTQMEEIKAHFFLMQNVIQPYLIYYKHEKKN